MLALGLGAAQEAIGTKTKCNEHPHSGAKILRLILTDDGSNTILKYTLKKGEMLDKTTATAIKQVSIF